MTVPTCHQLFTMDVNQKLTKKPVGFQIVVDIQILYSLDSSNIHQKQNFINHILFTVLTINCKYIAIFCCCTAWFMSDLVGNTEYGFSRDSANMSLHNTIVCIWSPGHFIGAPYGRVLRPLSSNNCGFQLETGKYKTYKTLLGLFLPFFHQTLWLMGGGASW